MGYQLQAFKYIEEDLPFFVEEVEVPIIQDTYLGPLILAYSRQKLIYGRVTVEPVLGLYEYELIGKINQAEPS
jgi:hypothetical protein